MVRTSNDGDADDGQNNDADQVGSNGVPSDEDDEVDEPPSALLIALQKRKTEKRDKKRMKAKRNIGSGGGGTVVRSFDIEEAADDGDGEDAQTKRKKSRRKKRKRGLGFGGGGDNDNMMDGDTNNDEIDDEIMGSRTINTYGKEALEKLKSEQKLQTVPQWEPLKATTSFNTDSLKNGDSKIISNPPEESFISLDDLGEGNDTGSENYGRKMEQENEKMYVVNDPLPDESNDWERQIEQRAGIKASSISTYPSKNTTTTSKLLSLDELSQKLQSTVETIDRQKEELQNATNRLRADRNHAMTNSKDHQETLRKTGLACEFYQSTRRDLTLWVGALRDLQEKVSPIAAAFREMLRIQTNDFGHEFRAWQDDCVETLYQTNRLDRVLGRQPESTLLSRASNETVIDEFGRDVRSQYLRDRELRFKDRIEYIHRNNNRAIIKREDHDEEERSKILQEALSAALEDLDQKYTSVTQLKIIFDGWFAAYVDDYQQCFATLSFGDLYAVLMQAELCKSNLFPDVLSSLNRAASQEQPILEIDHCFSDTSKDQEKEEEKYTAKNKSSKVTIENEGRLARVVEKGVLPVLVKILNNDEDGGNDNDSLYLFFSSIKSRLISKLINDVAIQPLQHGQNSSNGKSLNSNLRQQLQNLVSTAIKNALGGISIPLLNKGNSSGCDDDSGNNGTSLAFRFASVYLVQILQQALCNIIIYWFPLIDVDTNSNSSSDGQAETGIHCVLNFINEKYLVLLSSIENAEEATSSSSSSSSSEPSLSSAKAFFKPVWEALNNTNTESRSNIIELPSLMLSTLPLRAAARAYELN